VRNTPGTSPTPPGRSGASWVLVADDDADIRLLLCRILQSEGYTVLEAGDGLAALRAVRTSLHPLVVLLDWNMPRLDGAGVLAAVADDHLLAVRHAFVLMTAAAETAPPALARLLARVGAHYLPKPFDVETVVQVVAQAARHTTLPLPPHAAPDGQHYSTP
jgi:two-component system, chemotaxis family, chemotaxis protein CheY